MVFIVLGILASILAVYGLADIGSPKGIHDLAASLGDWNMYLIVVGPALVLIGIWYVYTLRRDRKRFEELMTTTSKSKLLTHRRELEELAWELTKEDRQRLSAKKKELKIR